jgi:hypothetical protein
VTGPAAAFDLVVVNDAYFSIIHELYIAPAKTKKWGDNKLQNQKIARSGKFTIKDVAAGTYDLKVVDDDKDTCIIPDINVDQNKEWKLTDQIMLTCQHE